MSAARGAYGARSAGGAAPSAAGGRPDRAGQRRSHRAEPAPTATEATRVTRAAGQPARRSPRALAPVQARPPGTTLVVFAALALSLLGVVYLLQISRVASYGYQLATLQQRLAQLDRENELLLYRVSEERSLQRVDDLARRDYGMAPLDPSRLPQATATAGATRANAAVGGAARPTARYQFVSVQRPPAAPPTPTSQPAPPLGPLDRLWQRIVGVGQAGAGAR